MIRLTFSDFWPGFDASKSWFYNLLSNKFPIQLVDDSPDIVFHSCFGRKFTHFNATRIFFTGENVHWNFRNSDFIIGFDRDESARKIRYPLYLLYSGFEEINNRLKPNLSRKFCSFVSSRKTAYERNFVFQKLNRFKTVDSGGRVFNNVGGPVSDKRSFISEYDFNLAFENSSRPGYCTEKIVDAFVCNTVPIYWGDPTADSDFNSQSFVNAHEFSSFSEVVQKVISLSQNRDQYQEVLLSNPMRDPMAFKQDHDDKIIKLFQRALDFQTLKNKKQFQVLRNWVRPKAYRRLGDFWPLTLLFITMKRILGIVRIPLFKPELR